SSTDSTRLEMGRSERREAKLPLARDRWVPTGSAPRGPTVGGQRHRRPRGKGPPTRRRPAEDPAVVRETERTELYARWQRSRCVVLFPAWRTACTAHREAPGSWPSPWHCCWACRPRRPG